MEKSTIITHKLNGKSNRWIMRETGIDRKTVARYWSEYNRLSKQLVPDGDNREVQEQIVAAPKYDAATRRPIKYTDAIDKAIDVLLESETEKARELGDNHKQKLTVRQIHRLVRDQGHDIGLTVVTMRVSEKRKRLAEAFIRQEYDFGQRVEYDFGEVKLVINGIVGKYYLAVFGSPASSFRWAYLYTNQKKDVFLDSHVRFFDMIGGVYSEVVYDNMRNVVTAFIGKNEKELNTDLIAMSMYYGFTPNVTNCFRGNEKGFVESSIRDVRNEVYAIRYRFDTLDDAEHYLEEELCRMNESSRIDEEMSHLRPWRPPLELSRMTTQNVDKYSFVRVDNNFYSVPEYLVGKDLTVRSYVKDIIVYSGLNEVCRHRRIEGYGEMSVNIFHYLDTLIRKPGALRNSKALRSEADLKAVFDCYYVGNARKFIEILRENQSKPMDEIINVLQLDGEGYSQICPEEITSNVMHHTQNQLYLISDFFMSSRTV
jgi:transposase